MKIFKKQQGINLNNIEQKSFESFTDLINFFNTYEKNKDIQDLLDISREAFNKRQKKLFNFIIKHNPKLIEIASNFSLLINLSEEFEKKWIKVIKRVLNYLNKDISTTEYIFKNETYILKKNFYNKRWTNSDLFIEIKKTKKDLIPIDILSKKLNVSIFDLREALLKPLNDEFILIGNYISCKNHFRYSIEIFLKKTKTSNIIGLYKILNEDYNNRLKQININSFDDFINYISLSSDDINIVNKITSENLLILFTYINKIIKEHKIKLFDTFFLHKYLLKIVNHKDILPHDENELKSILTVYKDYFNIKDNIFSITEMEKHNINIEKAIKESLIRNYDLFEDTLINDIEKNGRIITKEELKKHFFSSIK